MQINKPATILFCLALLNVSCTKVIDVTFNNESDKLVIEGNITNTNGPQVITLSKNVAFSNTNDYPAVSGATITVTDQAGQIFSFTEGPVGTYSNSQLKGVEGSSYQMTVVTNGVTYTANSTIPALVALDSLTSGNQTGTSSDKPKKEISVYYRDPVGIANQYRVVFFVNNVQVKSIFAFDDEFNDGKSARQTLRQRDIDIYAGDTIRIEMQCIDKPIYQYWYTLYQQEPNGPGGSAAPADPPTNITPDVLGYFSAHTTQAMTIIAK